MPSLSRGSGGGGADPQDGPIPPRADQVDPQIAAPVGDVLERAMRAKGARGASSGGAPPDVLGILPRGERSTFGCATDWPRGRVGSRWRRDRRRPPSRIRLRVGLARRREDEQRREADEDRAGQGEDRSRRARVERAVEQGAEPVSHCRPPRFRKPAAGRSRRSARASRPRSPAMAGRDRSGRPGRRSCRRSS